MSEKYIEELENRIKFLEDFCKHTVRLREERLNAIEKKYEKYGYKIAEWFYWKGHAVGSIDEYFEHAWQEWLNEQK